MKIIIVLATIFALPFNSVLVRAQDSHYWTTQYGSRAQLLGGAVVGSVGDLSSTFYNPGAMALGNDPKLVLSTDALEVQRVRFEPGERGNLKLESWQSGSAPSIFALRFTYDWLKQNHFAIMFLTRHNFKYEVTGYGSAVLAAIDAGANERYAAAEINARGSLSEQWYGFTWARRIREKVGLGLTTVIANRSQRRRLQGLSTEVDSNGSNPRTVILWDEYSYWNVRGLWKVGISRVDERWSGGVTLTTPSVNFFGRGKITINQTLSGVDSSGTALASLASNTQKDLDATYHSPVSIAAGLARYFQKVSVHLTGEFFSNVNQYDVMSAESFTGQTPGTLFANTITDQLSSVANVAIGAEFILNPKVQFYGGFRTDFSAHIASEDTQLSLSTWNIYHTALGSAFPLLASMDFTLGVSYGFGSSQDIRILEVTAPGNPEPITRDLVRSARYDRFLFILGIAIPLGDGGNTAINSSS